MGRLRELLPEIEAAQIAGNTNKAIVETLNAQGLDITLASFPTMLHRARKGLKKPMPEKTKETKNPPTAGGVKSADKKNVVEPTPSADKPAGVKKTATQEELKQISRTTVDLSQYEDDNS